MRGPLTGGALKSPVTIDIQKADDAGNYAEMLARYSGF